MLDFEFSNRTYTIEEIKAILTPIFKKSSVKQAILFGSYSQGLASEKSDIDILVDSQLHGLAFFGLLEDIVSALQKEVDLIDTRQIREGSRMEEEIRKNGIEIYAA